jgi:cyclopropane fatty-acyl-phospholipid synthase-like methyltransferase
LKSIEEKLDFEKGISILDVGCGAGQWIMVTGEPFFY